MKKIISLFIALIMIIASFPAIIISVFASAPTPLYSFNFEADNAMYHLVNTHLNVSYDKTEAALRFINNNESQKDQGITPTAAEDKDGDTTNTNARKNAAEQLKKARYVVITYRNRSELALGSIRTNINGRDYNRLYNMKTKMESYEDVIVPTPDGAVYRDGGAANQAPFCMYFFASVGSNKLKVGLAQMLYVKNIAFFEKYGDAEAYAKANVASTKTTGYTYADPDKVDTGINADMENISGLLADAVNSGKNDNQTTNENIVLEEKLFSTGADIIEWHFNNANQVTKHTTNTNNYNAVYDKQLNAMVFTPRKAGNAGDQGIVAAKTASEEDVQLRKDFVENAQGNYKYMVLTYLNKSNVGNMTFRYLNSTGNDVRAQVNIKTVGECAGKWQRVVIDATNGLVLRDSTAVSMSNLCFFPLSGQVTEKDSIAWKTLAFFKTKEAAEAYAAELSGSDAAEENSALEEKLFSTGADIIEWHFNNANQVTKHTTNTNNFSAVYDKELDAMVFTPKKAGNAGDQGIVSAKTASEEDVQLRKDFVENAPGKYKYMVLTYLNKSDVSDMIFRYMLPTEKDARATIKIKTEEECAGKWQRVVIDATNGLILRSSTAVNMSNLCFFPLSGQVTEKDSIAWKTLAFFKTKEAAEAYAAEEVSGGLPEELVAGRTDKPFIAGYEGRIFKPEGKMTRAEAVTVVTRLLVDETTIKGKNTSAFADVKAGAWYYDYVAYLESLGYLKSYSGSFKPDQPITRAEFVELVYNMGKVQATDKQVSFKDVPANHARYNVIIAAASAGLVNGYPDGTFKPDGTITRAEVVKVICAALGRTPTLEGMSNTTYVGFADIEKEHWAFPYVIEAATEHKLSVDEKGDEFWIQVIDNNFYLEKATDEYIVSLDAEFEARKEEILNTKSEWTLGKGGTVYYVSNDGNDTNDGKSADKPIKTISRLNAMINQKKFKRGDVVLFKRGDEWHEKLNCANGVTYSAYGEGPKPRILGSIEADNADQWIATEVANIYKFNRKIYKEQDVGNIVFNDGEAYGMRVLKEWDKDKTVKIGDNSIVSNGLTTWSFPVQDFKNGLDLKHHLAYYHDWSEQTVYLYCEGGNPGDVFDSIEISTKGNVVNGNSNVTIDNLSIRYGATHGIGVGSCENFTVRNCEVGFIGGAIQDLNNPKQGRLGNGIEVYGSANGYYVYNNYVYQCFDCGPTVQWQGELGVGKVVSELDIEIHDNVIEKCNSPLEVWCTASTPITINAYAILKNCNLYNNLCRSSGYGFGGYIHQKTDYNMFYGAGQTYAIYENCFIQNNKMWNIRKYLQKAVPTHVENGKGFNWRNNIIVMAYDGPLALLGSDIENATGDFAKFMYNNETIRKLYANGCYGFNRFMYTLADGQKDPAK